MNTRLPAHGAERALAFHLEYRFLDAAERTVRLRYHLNPPATALGESGVHAEEVRREDGGLVAAGTATDLDDGGTVVERVVGNEGWSDSREQVVDGLLEAGRFGLRLLRHLGVRRI